LATQRQSQETLIRDNVPGLPEKQINFHTHHQHSESLLILSDIKKNAKSFPLKAVVLDKKFLGK